MHFQIHKGSKSFGDKDLMQQIQFEIKHDEKIAIVGRNGCGKTTLLKIIAGVETLDSGDIQQASNTTIGYLSQTTFQDVEHTVREELESVFIKIHQCAKELEAISQQLEKHCDDDLLERYAQLQHTYEEMGGYTYEADMLTIFTKFQFCKEDLDRKIATFSGGQKTRIAFVKLLLSKPDILLLDEPTNHLDIETIAWLEGYIKRYPKAVILVSHDRMFIDAVVHSVYELSYGKLVKYTGNYSAYVEKKKQDQTLQQSAYARQQKEIERMEALIEKFRYKKSKASFAQSKIKYLERMDKIEAPKSNDKTFHARFVPRIQGGERVLEIDHLQIGYDTPLCEVNLQVMRSQRIAIIGPNGKGKSTLMKTLMKQVPALGGSFLYGHQIEPGYFDQEFAQFESRNTVLEEVWNAYPDLTRTQIRTALGCFLFQGDDVLKTINCLSGGEKVCLALVKLMLQQPNFLLMDEPTNHLDLLGKEALEQALSTYEGTMLFVSHDRYFISKLATAILVVDGGKATYYPLTYDEYKMKEKEEVIKTTQDKVKKPQEKRINYKKEVGKLEKKIEEKEKEVEVWKELRFDPAYYEDYKKMQELDAMIDHAQEEIQKLMELWEEYSSYLVDF